MYDHLHWFVKALLEIIFSFSAVRDYIAAGSSVSLSESDTHDTGNEPTSQDA